MPGSLESLARHFWPKSLPTWDPLTWRNSSRRWVHSLAKLSGSWALPGPAGCISRWVRTGVGSPWRLRQVCLSRRSEDVKKLGA